jgi:hypothetical protein
MAQPAPPSNSALGPILEGTLVDAIVRHYTSAATQRGKRAELVQTLSEHTPELLTARRDQYIAQKTTTASQRHRDREKRCDAVIALFDAALQKTADPAHALNLIEEYSRDCRLRLQNAKLTKELQQAKATIAAAATAAPLDRTLGKTPHALHSIIAGSTSGDVVQKPKPSDSSNQGVSTCDELELVIDESAALTPPPPKPLNSVIVVPPASARRRTRENSRDRQNRLAPSPRTSRDRDRHHRSRSPAAQHRRSRSPLDRHRRSPSPIVDRNWRRNLLAHPAILPFNCPCCHTEMSLTVAPGSVAAPACGSRRR